MEKLRKTILPNHYYIWEEKIKERLAQCLKENINFVLLITLFFTFLFVFLLYVGLKPWYSVWVLLLGFLFVFLKYRKIAILEKMYLSVLTASIVPTLILARLIFIECFFFLAELLGKVWPVLLVFPEGSLKKAVYVVKNFVNAQHGWYSEVVVTDEKVKKIGELRNEEKGTKKLIQTWENILKDFVMKENALHHAKLSNLVKLEGKSILLDYKYNTVLSKFLKPPVDLLIKEEDSMGLISFLNSPEATDFIMKLKESLRKD